MDRRKTLKSLLVGTVSGGLIMNGCTPEEKNVVAVPETTAGKGYGRTPKEIERDLKLNSEKFFNDHELETIAVLCDLILPASDTAGSATDAMVPQFIEFIAKDLPNHKTPLRGGIMWLDQFAMKSYGLQFKACNDSQQQLILDQIAYPDNHEPEVAQGVQFFTRIRNLTLTGYYTTEMGIKDLGYKGNTPNVWDGVPENVLKKHGLSYEKDWLDKCVDQDKRNEIAQWDDEGNLLT